jgi:hypothetical protein
MPCPAQKRVAGSGPRELSFAGPMELTGSGVQACMNGELNGRVGVQCSAIFSMLCCAVQYCGVYVDWAGCWHHGSATAVVLGLVHDSGLWARQCRVTAVLQHHHPHRAAHLPAQSSIKLGASANSCLGRPKVSHRASPCLLTLHVAVSRPAQTRQLQSRARAEPARPHTIRRTRKPATQHPIAHHHPSDHPHLPVHPFVTMGKSASLLLPSPRASVTSLPRAALRCPAHPSFTSSLPRAFGFDTPHHPPPRSHCSHLPQPTIVTAVPVAYVFLPLPPLRFAFPLRTFGALLDLGLDLGRAILWTADSKVLEVPWRRRRRP